MCFPHRASQKARFAAVSTSSTVTAEHAQASPFSHNREANASASTDLDSVESSDEEPLCKRVKRGTAEHSAPLADRAKSLDVDNEEKTVVIVGHIPDDSDEFHEASSPEGFEDSSDEDCGDPAEELLGAATLVRREPRPNHAPKRESVKSREKRLARSAEKGREQLAVLVAHDDAQCEKIKTRLALIDKIEADGDDLWLDDKVLQVVNHVRVVESCAEIAFDDEAFVTRAATSQLKQYLWSLITRPFSFDLQALLNAGILVEVDTSILDYDYIPSPPIDNDSACYARFYQRMVIFQSYVDMLVVVKEYCQVCEADNGFLKAVELVVQWEVEKGTLNVCTPCQLSYHGMTVAGTPASRYLKDGDGAAQASRLANFLATRVTLRSNGHEQGIYKSFEVPSLRLELERASDATFSLTAGRIESIGIMTSYGYSLNRARGGVRHDFELSRDDLLFMVEQGITTADFDRLVPLDTVEPLAKIQQLKFVLSDDFDAWNRQPRKAVGHIVDVSTPEGVAAYQAIEDGLTRLQSRGSIVPLLLAPKDIPLASVRGHSTYSGATAATGPHLMNCIERHLFRLSSTSILAPYCGFWVFCTIHILVIFALAQLSRKIQIIDPYIVQTRSSKVFGLFENNRLVECFDWDVLQSEEYERFRAGNGPMTDDIYRVILCLVFVIIWSETPTKCWISRLGTVFVARTGPGAADLRLGICNFDPGFNAHDPAFHPLVLDLEITITMITGIAMRQVLLRVAQNELAPTARGDRELYFRTLVDEINIACMENGLKRRLEEGREKLDLLVSSLDGVRMRAGSRRAEKAMEIDVEELAEERSAATTLKRLNARVGPTFEGDPALVTAAELDEALQDGKLDVHRLPFHLQTEPRILQLEATLAEHCTAVLDCRRPTTTLQPGIDAGSVEHALWFLGAERGLRQRYSASKKGKKMTYMAELDEEELEERHEGYVKRGYKNAANIRAQKGVSNPSERTVVATAKALGGDWPNDDTKGQQSRRSHITLSCDKCGEWFCTLSEIAKHICMASGTRIDLSYQLHSDVLRKFRPLYPHALFLLHALDDSEISLIVQEAGLAATLVSTILSPAVLAKLGVTVPLSIYHVPGASAKLKTEMSYDRILFHRCPPPSDSVKGERDGDTFWPKAGRGPDLVKGLLGGKKFNMRSLTCPETKCPSKQFELVPPSQKRKSTIQHRCTTGRQATLPYDSLILQSFVTIPLGLARRLLYATTNPKDELMKDVAQSSRNGETMMLWGL